MAFYGLILFSCLSCTDSGAQLPARQFDSLPAGYSKWLAPAIHITAAASSLYTLNKTWYAEYPSQRFHFTNDMHDWRLMDKGGHAWTAYTLSKISAAIWEQNGISPGHSTLYAGISALGYQTMIECFDGISSRWGFSWGDMGANILGTGAYVLQQAIWNNQVVQLKFMSFNKITYPAEVRERADALFGHTFTSRLLNDYNAQSYWASVNLRSLFPKTILPAWLNMAVGYGAGNMLGETSNRWISKNEQVIDRSDLCRYSRFLLSPDIDFTRFKTRHTWLRVLLFMANAIKIPAPSLEYSRGSWKGYLLLFN